MNSRRSFVMENQNLTNLLVTFAVGIILISKTGYSLGWDDSDYMRMIMCSVNSIENTNLNNLIHCQGGLYKAPIFLNLFVLPTAFFLRAFETLNLSDINIISTLCVFLSFICFVLSRQILTYLGSKLAKVSFVVILFSFARKFNFLFMTDLFLALLTTYICLYFISIYKLKNLENVGSIKRVSYLSVLIVCAVGTKFSAATLLLYLLILWLKYLVSNKVDNQFLNFILISTGPIIIFIFLLATIWRSAWSAGLSMFIGTQSEYYSSWFGSGIPRTLSQIEQFYAIPCLMILLMTLIKLSKKESRDDFYKLFLPLSPMLVGFVMYLISKTQDPRFLLPILMPMSIVILASMKDQQPIKDPRPSTRNERIISTVLFSSMIVGGYSHYSNRDFDLFLPNLVYDRLETYGSICPLTDSPRLNISKLLLIDAINNTDKSLETRILNIPDLAMNGLSRNEAVTFVESNCKFLYSENGIAGNTYKNEYLESYLFLLAGKISSGESNGVQFYSQN